jgi:hypothetical protein
VILEILFAQIIRHIATVADGSNVEFFARALRKLSLRGKRSYSSEHGLFRSLKLDKQILSVHWNCVQFWLVRNCKVRMELKASLGVATKNSYNMTGGEQVHVQSSLSIAALTRIGILKHEPVECDTLLSKCGP